MAIYLDYMATTPVAPEVAEKMSQCLTESGTFGNPASSTHAFGWEALKKVEEARSQVAHLINASPREIVWTSGATEADNLALKGAALFYQRKGKHIITVGTEHKAVLDTCDYLKTLGFEISIINPKPSGLIDVNELAQMLRPDTILVSVMAVNNETGIIQDIAAIGKLLSDKGIIFHVDAAQAAGKIPIDCQQLNVSLMSFSGHKIHGPKGIGALYVSRSPRVRLEPRMHGGHHERGLRSGTLPTHQIVGMGEAFALAEQRMSQDMAHVKACRDQFWSVLGALDGVHLNADLTHCVPNCLNFSIDGIAIDALLLAMPDVAFSTGSACSSGSSEPTHVLLSMGYERERARHAVRVSFGRYTDLEEVAKVADLFKVNILRLRNKDS